FPAPWQTLIVVEAFVSNALVRNEAKLNAQKSLWPSVYQSAIAERIPFVTLKDAHRQIYAKDAGGAAGGAGPRVATEQFRNYERTFSFRSSEPKRWDSAHSPREEWR